MLKELKISELTLWDKNPREITPENLEKLKKEMLEDKDWIKEDPIHVNQTKNKNIVFIGNHRVKAAIELGWDTIFCNIHKDMPIKLMEKERYEIILNLRNGITNC